MWTALYGIPKKVSNFLHSEVFTGAHIGQHASVLTLATLFALVPMVSGLVWLIGQVPSYQTQLFEQFDLFLSYLVPDQAIVWRSRMSEWTSDVSSLQSFSLIMLFVSILFLVNQVDKSLHHVFHFGRKRGGKRWLHYLWVMPVLMAIIVLSMTLVVLLQILLGTGLAALLPGVSLSSIPAMCLLLFAMYRLSSRNSVSNTANIMVSIGVTAAFYLLKMSFAWLYLNLPNWSIVFGVFSAIPLFLLWCQMAWSLLLYGALLLRWLSQSNS